MSDNINVEVKRKNPSIPPKNLRQLTKQVAEIEGTIDDINESVEETEQDVNEIKRAIDNSDDFVIIGNKFKRKNKAYNPAQYSGLGEIYLEKNETFLGREFNEFVTNVTVPDPSIIADAIDGIVYDRGRKEFLAYELVEGERVYYAEWIKFDKWESTDDYVPEAGYDFICEADDKAYRWTEETTPDLIETIAHYGNVLKQEMVNLSNTIYHIQYDYDLNGKSVEFPEKCILQFEGGSLVNGTIIGNNTAIKETKNEIFNGIFIKGSWSCPYITSNWLKDIHETNRLIELFKFASDDIHNTIIIEDGDYFIDTTATGYSIITGTSNLKLEILGNIYLNSHNSGYYRFFVFDGKKNIHICGRGKLEGDRATNTATGEWGHGIWFNYVENVLIEGITITMCFGDCLNFYTECKNIEIAKCNISWARRCGIALYSFTNANIHDNNFDGIGTTYNNIPGTSPASAIEFEADGVPSDEFTNLNIKNNKFTQCEYSIMLAGRYKLSNAIIENNYIENSTTSRGACILIDNNPGGSETIYYKNIKIINNILKNGHAYGIGIKSRSNVIIENNEVVNSEFGGIHIEYCNAGVIKNNRIVGTNETSYWPKIKVWDTCSNIEVSNNYIKANQGLTIFGKHCTIANNTVEASVLSDTSLIFIELGGTNNMYVGNKFINTTYKIQYKGVNCTYIENVIEASNYATILGTNVKLERNRFVAKTETAFFTAFFLDPNFVGECIDTEIENCSSPYYSEAIINSTNIKLRVSKKSGPTSERPPFNSQNGYVRPAYAGTTYFDTDLGKEIYYNGDVWVDEKGFSAGPSYGPTSLRPIAAWLGILTTNDIGYPYYDTDLNKMIYVKSVTQGGPGSVVWADALGNPVETVYPKVNGSPTTGNLVKFNGNNIEDAGITGTGTAGNFAGFDNDGKLSDSGSKPSDFEPAQS